MSTREDLEAALRARPDEVTLAVYADFLQAEGDPRGELIALDLRPPAMSTHGLEVRRGQLLRAWLGDDLDIAWDPEQQLWYAGDLDGSYATFDCGLIDLLVDGEDIALARLLLAPAGEHLRRVSLRGTTALLGPMLAHLAERPRPWLSQLSLARTAGSGLLVGQTAGERLVEATPNLEVLDLAGTNLFDRFGHVNVRKLGLVGCAAIDLVGGAAWPALSSIDFVFDGERPVPRGLFDPACVPALRRLDGSREEPGGRRLFEALGTLAVAPQLTQLVLPSIRTHRDHGLAQAAIDRMPNLRELVIARAYSVHGRFDDLRHAYARVKMPLPYPWRPRETHGVVLIDECTVDLAELVDLLEAHDHELSEDVRAIWHRFWFVIDDDRMGHAFSAADLVVALEPLPLTPRLAWLRDHLRQEIAERGSYLAVLRDA